MKSNHHAFVIPFLILQLLAVAGCSSQVPLTKTIESDDNTSRSRLDSLVRDSKEPKQDKAKESHYSEQDDLSIVIKPLDRNQQDAKEKEWLTGITFSLDPAKNASIPATTIIRMFREKGINIVTAVPLDSYSYNGFGVTAVNAETALMVFFGAMQLDFEIDNARKLVTILPMKSQTWTLNIGDRQTAFSAGSDSQSSSSNSSQSSNGNNQNGTNSSTTNPSQSSSSTGVAGSTFSTSGSGTGSSSSNSGSSSTSGNVITSKDDIWSKLAIELEQRVVILMPRNGTAGTEAAGPIVPALSQPQGNQGKTAKETDLFNVQKVGRVSINPSTGAVTVIAPKYILKPLNEYMRGIQKMYNTVLIYEAEIVTVTTNKTVSEGIDWSAFNSVNHGAYQTIVQNNILGGVTLTPSAGTSSLVNSVAIGNSTLPGASALMGVASATGKFAAFNAFLTSIGQMKIKDTPRVTTTSGIPVRFDNTTTRHYLQYQQSAATGGVGSAAVATNTVYVPYDTGMSLRLNPRYDAESGLIRSGFYINRKMLNGTEPQVNAISNGTSIQNITVQVPIIANTSQDGELLMKDDEMVVVGGLTEDTETNNDSGVTGLVDSPLKNLTGQGSRNKTTTTYYIALTVHATEKTK